MTAHASAVTSLGRAGTTRTNYFRSIPSSAVSSSNESGWQGVHLQRFQLASLDLNVDAICVPRVTLHLAGPVLIERTIEGRHHRLWSDSGHSNVIPAGVPVIESFKGHADFTVAHLDPRLVKEVAESMSDLPSRSAELILSIGVIDETLNRLGWLLLTEMESKASGTALFADYLTRALTFHLLRACSSNSPVIHAPPPLPGWRLRRAIEHMRSNLAEDLSLASLAAVAGLGPTQFARAFRHATGDPPHRYLIRLRVEEARQLLEHTKLSIIEVALQCGFEQPSHFATMFRKLTGLSPSAYRKARCT